jgi:CRP/FNR family cyclic AMP-dependent transcriptional regulator
VETVDFLERVELFKHLKRSALERVATQMRAVHFSGGHMILDTKGDTTPAGGLYIIKSGMAKVTKGADSWEAEAVLGILRQGQWFGEIGPIDGLPPPANVTAMEPMECYFLPREAFMSALENSPEIAVGMLPGLGTMVRSADQWIAQLL